MVFGYHRVASWFGNKFRRQGGWLAFGLLFLVAVALQASLPICQKIVGPYFSTDARFGVLRNFMLTVGGALIGATAIALSFVLFAMQVNVTRMPQGLFRRLSSDWRLLLAFIGTFAIAVAVAAASLSSDASYAAALLIGSFEAIALTLVLFAYAYRRALRLIAPIEQLQIILSDAQADISRWERRAVRAAVLIKLPEEVESESPKDRPDLARMTFFQGNPAWNQSVTRGIRYATAYSRYYAQQGDHEVSGAALQTIVNLNLLYVRAKGRTFFANTPLIESPLVTDGVINNSLEQINQNVRIALSRDDHQQVEENLRTFAALCSTYLGIDYAGMGRSKTHALIAAFYLSDAVQSVVAKDMPDVVMEGVRIMGTEAIAFICRSNPIDAVGLIDRIGVLGCVGIAQEKLRPVTQTAMDQLAMITLYILQVDQHRVDFTFDNVRESALLIAKLFLNVPDQPFASAHSVYLGPYYSSTSDSSLRTRLIGLVNELTKDGVDRAAGENITSNLANWSENLAETQKELLLLAVEKRSHFTFDIITWIVGVTEILLATAKGPAARDHDKEKLRENALHLICTLSWLPRDKESATFLENFRVVDSLFEAAMDARRRDAEEVSDAARKMILRWGMEAGAVATGWATLEKSVLALAALALPENAQIDQLKLELIRALSASTVPSPERRSSTARGLRNTARELRARPYTIDPVARELGRHDRPAVRALLNELADLMNPPTTEEPALMTEG
ncbi:MAG TPA: hypothetical protein VG166_09875 [Caulobacteraceae bacterium]|nr:hypothetical protein [Caulobacteraceae bacterium]